ncbi:MAG TPA: DUF5947 family protein [Acidobacteriaceae bacterium]|nr:DUF5947 family protein [Terriglobia bacterium]HVC90674.1 DUF5947 family protein [Acidobacteriaceae bacterium]
MSEIPTNTFSQDAIPAVLRQFSRRRSTAERCDLCSAELGPAHSHLLEPSERQILCACEACALLFCGQAGVHYLRIPRRIRVLPNFQMTEMQWEALMIPINLAFFYYDSSRAKMIAMYPGPAGATESLLSLDSWEDIRSQNHALQKMEPDVEAFLVNRAGSNAENFVVPIDECFRLVGLIRMHWKGFSGGTEVWKQIEHFFTELRLRSTSTHTSNNVEVMHA